MALTQRRKSKHSEDGDAEKERKQQEAEEKKKWQGEEYEVLLRYVEEQAKKAKNKQDDDDDDDEHVKYIRKWYMPWKKIKVETHSKKVPAEWLETDPTKGLSSGDIEERRKLAGWNELESPEENQLLKFISYFRGPILYVMEIAVILALGLREWIDFGVIIAILLMNAIVGWQAGDIVAQLKAGIALKATVIRDGQESEIEARELVPGDILLLEEGNTIAADSKIIRDYEDKDGSKAKAIVEKQKQGGKKQNQQSEKPQRDSESTHNEDSDGEGDHADDDDDDKDAHKGPSICSVDQSAITGESLAADKFIGDIAYYTCGLKRGKCYAVMTVSAKNSFVGRTANLVSQSNEKGHFQIVLGGIGTTLLVLVVVFIFAVWIGGFFRNIDLTGPPQNNLFVYALIFLVIGVPVGLPVVTTTTLAVGAAYLARRKAIVQKLTAIESLAGVDILCSDKTGTLTANKLSLNEPYIAPDVDPNWFMCVAVLASSHNVKGLDPIDKVTIVGLKDFPKAQEMLKAGWKTHKFTPFDPVSKRITAEVEKDGKKFTCAKGAPNAILKLQKFDPETVAEYRGQAQQFATRGFRSLGVAAKEDGKDWQLLGILAMSDPPRGDTARTISEAHELGIQVKMLTGDAVAIAKETCKQLGLKTNVYDSEKLIGGGMSGSDIRDFVEAADGFAEVFPEHKYQVVNLLQERGHLTAMTGDGVNDAPSLKKADCGIAVEGASDAARTAADVVFLDEGLSTIITAIKVARQIFHRMKAYIIYRIALCVHLQVYLMFSILILNETIRVDLIVFLAIFADVATIAIAYDRAPYARQPVEWQLPKVWFISTIMGLLLAAGTWILRGTLFLPNGGIIQNWGSVQGILFLEVSLTESWIIFVTRLAQERGTPNVWPSWQLIGAVLGVDILSTLFSIFGWLAGPLTENGGGGWTDVVTVVKIWLYSFGVTIIILLFYLVLNKITWFDNLSRKKRSSKNEKLENFLTNLQRLTLVHESDQRGEYFRFSNGAKDKEKAGESESKDKDQEKGKQAESPGSGKASPKGNGKGKGNGNANTPKDTASKPGSQRGAKGDDGAKFRDRQKDKASDPAEGDKQMSDQMGAGGQAEKHKRSERQTREPEEPRTMVSTKDTDKTARSGEKEKSTGPTQASVKNTTDEGKLAGAQEKEDEESSTGTKVDE